MNTPNNTTATVYTNQDLSRAGRVPGGNVAKLLTPNVQPTSVRVTKGKQHRYLWGQDAMDFIVHWRAEEDARILAKKEAREAKKAVVNVAPPIVTTEPTVGMAEVVEQLKFLNQTMTALLNIWNKE